MTFVSFSNLEHHWLMLYTFSLYDDWSNIKKSVMQFRGYVHIPIHYLQFFTRYFNKYTYCINKYLKLMTDLQYF